MNVTIRPASPSDAARIHEVHVASVRALCAPVYEQTVVDVDVPVVVMEKPAG
jgi:hypothetical protein